MITGSIEPRAWLRWQLPHVAFACAYFPVTYAKRVFVRDPYGRLDPLARRFRDKWGWLARDVRQRASRSRPIWINLTSGGEVAQSRGLLKQLAGDADGFVFSTDAYDSHRMLTRTYGSDKVFFSPWDVGWPVQRVLDTIRPRALVFVHCAYSPVLMRAARRAGVKTLLVNGLVGRNQTVANPSMDRAMGLKFPQELEAAAVQTAEDVEMLASLGVPRDRIVVTGNLASDVAPLRLNGPERCRLRGELGLGTRAPVVIFGSTHEGEHELVRTTIALVRQRLPDARFIVAPRQMHDVEGFVDVSAGAGLRTVRHTETSSRSEPYDVLVVDTFGSLLTLYGAADVAYIGSSLVPLNARRGGHHPLEPLVHGTVPLFGPNMNLWRGAVERLRAAWPQIEVDSAATLAARAIDVIEGRAPVDAIRAAGNELIGESTGAVDKTVDFLRRELGALGTPSTPSTPSSI